MRPVKSDAIVDHTTIFHKPEQYDHARGGYPPEFIRQKLTAIREEMGNPAAETLNVVDIGAGTGRLGEQFLNNGCAVTFVEPVAESVAHLQKRFAGNPRAHIIHAMADQTQLPDHYADILAFGDSAHWIEPAALPELRRILKPDGKMAVFARLWSQDSPLTKKAHQLLLADGADCPEYRASPAQLIRNIGNLQRRHGRHLITEEHNFWNGYTYIRPYTKEDMMEYFRTASFSSDAMERGEQAFRANVVEPLWEYAKKNGKLDEKGSLLLPYEIHARHGSPRNRVIATAQNGVAQRQ